MSTFTPVENSQPGAGVMPARRPLRVLLVEDDPDDARLLLRHLTRSGYVPEIHRVETSEAMLEAFARPWDCVLADYNLPLFSAPEALRLLKSEGHDVPFIMMSGAVSEDTAVAAMRAGAHDYVSKENLTRLVPAIEREIAEAATRRVKRDTEEALRSIEARFGRLVEATPLALMICDMQGHVSYLNSGVNKLFGPAATGQDACAFTLARIFAAEDGEATDGREGRVAASLRRQLDAHHGETWETVCTRADGSPVTVLVGAAVLNPEVAVPEQQLAVFFVDLTEQKRGEEVLRRTEKLAAAGRLAAAIAHEINNPLEAVTNCLYLLGGGALDDASRSYLDMAQRELDRVTQITTQTLRFYRQSTRPGPTDIGELLDSVLALYEGRLRASNIELIRDYSGAPLITALDGEIRQVLANLVGNAIDAMASCPGPRQLVLRARARHQWSNGQAALSLLVADSGTGMTHSTLDRMFEPFFSTKGITGTGLGLWVTREILRKHNGQIQVKSSTTAPSGTTFRVLLPLSPSLTETEYESGLPTLDDLSPSS